MKDANYRFLRRAIHVFLLGSVILAIILIWAYFSIFNNGLSRKHSDWGEFGSFIGGTLGMIFSALNLLVLIYLAFKPNIEKRQQWLTELRAPFYKSIIENLYSFDFTANGNQNELDKYLIWINHLSIENNLFLIPPKLKEETEKLKSTLITSLNGITSPSTDNSEEFTAKLKYFLESRDKFARYLGDIMMNRTGLDIYN